MGSNAIRFSAASFAEPASFTVLATDRFPVRLGHDVFLTGRLTSEATGAALHALGTIAAALDELRIVHRRAVATSAVRESTNGESFLARVRKQTGLDLEVIGGQEEARLIHLAVASRIPLGSDRWLLVDVGGGSVEIALADASGVQWSESHTMGSVRLLEELTAAGTEPGRFGQIVTEYVSTLRAPVLGSGPRPAGFIATGGNAETIARLLGHEPGPDGVLSFSLAELRGVIAALSRLSFRQRVRRLGLSEDRADVILPAAIVYERLASLAGVDRVLAPNVGIREGVLLDLVDGLTAQTEHGARQEQELLASALALGRRYALDEPHARQVARLSLLLFDQLQPALGLEPESRRHLQAAALLHDLGAFVSYKKHHKHSLYLIANSELPGFSFQDMLVVANIARYHRKSEPEPDHEPFTRLSLANQRRVRRLAALLRIADALDREHRGAVRSLRTRVAGKSVRLEVDGDGDLLLERWAVRRKSDMLETEFALKVKIGTGRGGA